jgi:hypothetical protein
MIIMDNNSGIIPSDILGFKYSDFAEDFGKPILIESII